MPKLKTKSSAKKRFKISARGKVMMAQAGKRHGMIKRTNSQIRKLRGTTAMSKQDGKIVKSYMPYSLRGYTPFNSCHFNLLNYMAYTI